MRDALLTAVSEDGKLAYGNVLCIATTLQYRTIAAGVGMLNGVALCSSAALGAPHRAK
jgi:hypothetical protein